MPPLHSFPDDRIILTTREWVAMIDNMETLQKAVQKLERAQLVFESKRAVWMCIVGFFSGSLMSVVTAVVIHRLYP